MNVDIGRLIAFSDVPVVFEEGNEANLGLSDFFARRLFADREKNEPARPRPLGQTRDGVAQSLIILPDIFADAQGREEQNVARRRRQSVVVARRD